MKEVGEINAFMDQMGDDIEVIWGVTYDDSLDEKVKVTLLATGSEMSVVPDELREELRRKKEQAEQTGRIYTEEDALDTKGQKAEDKPQPKLTWAPKSVDPMQVFQDKLYGKQIDNESKVSISLDQIDDDDDMLRYMETVPAIKRN